jgi:predicted RNase H-like HicB family nuclease
MSRSAQGACAVRFYNFEIVVEKEPEDEGYLAFSPSLPGCFSNGRTVEEARQNIRDAIQQHLSVLLAHDQPVPQHENLVLVEALSVGVPA